MTNSKELIAEIESRIQLVIVLSIFAPVLLSALAGAGGADSVVTNNTALQSMMLVGIYLFEYLIFQFEKKLTIDEQYLNALNWSLLLGVAIFTIFVLFLTTANPKATMSSLTWWSKILFYISVWGLPLSAVISSGVAIVGICDGIAESLYKYTKAIFKIFKKQ